MEEIQVPRKKQLLSIPNQFWGVMGIIMSLVSIGGIIFAVAFPDWIWWKDWNGEENKFSLFACQECSAEWSGFTWWCFEQKFCQEHQQGNKCITGQSMTFAAIMYVLFSLISVFICVLLMERLYYMTISRDSGSPTLTYGLAAIAPFTYTFGIIAWTTKSSVNFNEELCDHAVYDQTGTSIPLWAGAGYWIALSVLVVILITSLIAAIAVYVRDDMLDNGFRTEQDDVFLGLGIKIWTWGIVLIILISLALTVGSMLSQRWILDEGSQDHTGSLFSWDVIEGYNNLGYQCLAGPSCASASSSVICKTLGDLHNAGVVYAASQIALLVVFCMWLENCIYLIAGRDFGHRLVAYFWPILAIGIQVFGIVRWFQVSGARFNGECDAVVKRTEKYELCALDGPKFAIAELALITLGAIIYLVMLIQKALRKNIEYASPAMR